MAKLTEEQKANRKWYRDYVKKERHEYRHVTRVQGIMGGYRQFPFFGGHAKRNDGTIDDYGVYLTEGGWCGRRWMTTDEIHKAIIRWVRASYKAGTKEAVEDTDGAYQCGGCRYFAAFDADYGLCCNAKSPQDGRVCFEHGGCYQHSNVETGIVDAPEVAEKGKEG